LLYKQTYALIKSKKEQWEIDLFPYVFYIIVHSYKREFNPPQINKEHIATTFMDFEIILDEINASSDKQHSLTHWILEIKQDNLIVYIMEWMINYCNKIKSSFSPYNSLLLITLFLIRNI